MVSKSGACLAFLAWVLAVGPSGGAEKDAFRCRPNLILLMTDQHRADCVGAYGNRVIVTPNLDRLAREGALFRAAYSSVPSCTPARATLLTGLSPWHHGMLGYGQIPSRYPRETPRMLADAGYWTIGIGKMHYGGQDFPHGFQRLILDEQALPGMQSPDDYRQWFRRVAPSMNPEATGISWNSHRAAPYALPEHLHPTRWTADEAIKFLENYKRPEPFFLKVSFVRPHSPYDPPRRWWDHYAEADLPPAAVGNWDERHTQRGKPFVEDLWQGDLGPEKVRRARQGYYASVSFVDEQIGRILDALSKLGLLEKTFILMTADHGDMTGDHHLWRKTYGYEPSARIPMIVRWPEGLVKASRGQVLSQPVELRDVLPTLLDAGGVAYDPQWFDGRSMLNLVRGRAQGWREWIDLEHSTCYAPENNWTGATDGRVKYIYYVPDGREQLFDLAKDPQENHNLAGLPEHRSTLLLWRERLIGHLSERGEPFVVDGKLGIRPKGTLYSPRYPRDELPKPRPKAKAG
jgi:choline-sulfatase